MEDDRYGELMAAQKERRLSVEERDELLALKGERMKERGTAKVRRARERMAKREAARRLAVGRTVLEAGVSSDDPAHIVRVLRYGEAMIAAGFATDDDALLRQRAQKMVRFMELARAGGRGVRRDRLMAEISERTGVSAKACAAVVDALTEIVVERMRAGLELRLARFGSFVPRRREARDGRNPRTGAAVVVPGRTIVRFRPAQAVRDVLVD